MSVPDANRFLIDPVSLAARLDEPRVRIVDASWYLPAMRRDARAEHLGRRVPGAVFFDLDRVADTGSGLPHTLASPERFAAEVGALGIGERDTIVCYDGLGLFSAARAWWNFRIMGAADVRVLDGGLPAWLEAGLPTESGEPDAPAPADFSATFDAARVRELATMRDCVAADDVRVIDVRPAGRFSGSDPEPRAGMRSGHMPGATNLPFERLLENGRLRSNEALAAVFDDAGIAPGDAVVTSCGSGVTAAIANLALEGLGRDGSMLYDGSWSEWGGRDDTPVTTG